MIVRRAQPGDCHGVQELADSISMATLRAGDTPDDALQRTGFLLYPLAADHPTEPCYRERIELGDHCWVATDSSGKIIAFLIGYSFKVMKSIKAKTDNDRSVLEHFLGEWGVDEEVIYLQQGGSSKKLGIMRPPPMLVIAERFLETVGRAPAAITEVSQAPIRNAPSIRYVEQVLGFRLVARRMKDVDVPGKPPRISGTFMRTFGLTEQAQTAGHR